MFNVPWKAFCNIFFCSHMFKIARLKKKKRYNSNGLTFLRTIFRDCSNDELQKPV